MDKLSGTNHVCLCTQQLPSCSNFEQQQRLQKRRCAETHIVPRWQAPDPGSIKINVDGAFKGNGEASIGVVIRDSKCVVLLSAWRVIFHAASAEEVELLACREGISLAVEWTPGPAILETDLHCARNSGGGQKLTFVSG